MVDPTNKTEVQSFIGFINFYRRFIANFSHIAKPLHWLTGNQDFEWGTEQQQAFDAFKERLCSEPVLRISTDDGPFCVETDCSQFAMGGVLSQYIDGKWHPIAYRSEALTAAERNYEIHDREMLAIMKALEDWRQYLLGAKHRVEVWTDHLNLTFFRSPQKLNRRQARWNTELQPYNLLIVHKPGAMMKKTDILSRLAQFKTGEDDNHDIMLLPSRFFAMPLSIFEPASQNLDKLR